MSIPFPETRGALPRYDEIRSATEALVAPLGAEDCAVQSMPDASPTKWHLAHTSWFFETFLLAPYLPGFRPFRSGFELLFNSYYHSIGPQHARPRRGLLTRPTLDEVFAYRRHVDEGMRALLSEPSFQERRTADDHGCPWLVELGLQHEAQHQELILMDLKHLFSENPLLPAYLPLEAPSLRVDARAPRPLRFLEHHGGLVRIGTDDAFDTRDPHRFAFDNEGPQHEVYVHPFELADRLVTNGEYLEFLRDDGYGRPELWLSEGWQRVEAEGWTAPLYWQERDGNWSEFTLRGLVPLDLQLPVSHLSYYEADAFARWIGARLPREEEWELFAREQEPRGNFVESGRLHPLEAAGEQDAAASATLPAQLHGDLWEWTQSAYAPYPGYRPWAGAVTEYNGKFMSNQLVLRGGSCVTPSWHYRASYRNFFHAQDRWPFTGLRLARDPLSKRTPTAGW